MARGFPFFRQLDQMDCGITCIRIIAKYYGKNFSAEFLNKQAGTTRQGLSLTNLANTAESIGFHALAVRAQLDVLIDKIPLPCIAHWKQNHFVVVYKTNKNAVYVADPAIGLLKYTHEDFMRGWTGRPNNYPGAEGSLLAIEPTPDFKTIESSDKKKYDYKFLLWYFRPYKKYIFQLFIGLTVGSLLQLILPFLTQSVVDYGINYRNINFIYLVLFAQITLFISQSTVELIRNWILLHMTSRVNISLISDFLLKLMRLPISFFDSKNTGDIIQRIHDHNRIQNFLSTTTLNTLFSIFNLTIFGIVLSYYSPTIFLIFLFGSTLYISWSGLFMKKRAALDYKKFSLTSDNQNSLFQLISGMQEIKLNGSEKRRRWEWESIQVRLFKNSLSGLSLSQSQQIGSRSIYEIQNILITFIAAKSVIEGEITLGTMLSIQYIIGQLNYPINNFLSFMQTAQDAKISLERMSEIHNRSNEDTETPNIIRDIPKNASIRLRNVSFSYSNGSGSSVLDNINLEIPEGKLTAIVGASGSGKTTLLKLLLRFYEPTSGSISVGDINLQDISFREWRKSCGSVMQDGFIFNDTITRNITESDSESYVDIHRLYNSINIANIGDYIDGLPLKYNTLIGPGKLNMSGGQKQRLLIARAVYKNPHYVFFDEATSSLDTNTEASIMKNLKKFYIGKTAVVVAHRLSTVKNADNIIVLERGRIVESGQHDYLISLRGSYYKLISNQLDLV